MKIIIVILLIITAIGNAFSKIEKIGQEKVDSLKLELSKVNLQDTVEARLFAELAKEYYYINPSLGIEYATKSVEMSIKCENKINIALSYKTLGLCYLQNSEYADALDCFYKSLKIDEEFENKHALIEDYINLGLVFVYTEKNLPEAEDYILKAKKISDESNDTLLKIKVIGNLGNCYYLMFNNTDKALNCYKEALNLANSLNSELMITLCYHNIGAYYKSQNDYNTAYQYYLKSFALNKKSECEFLLQRDYLGITEYFWHKIRISKKINRSDVDSFFDNAKYGIKLAEKMHEDRSLSIFYKFLSSYYQYIGNYKKALEYSNLSIKHQNIIKGKISDARISQTLMQKEREAKNNELKKLQDAARLNSLKSKYYSIIIFLAILITIIVFMFYIKKRKDNIRLVKQDKELKIANATKDKLMSIISHDLKNPILGFNNVVEILAQEYHNLKEDEILSYINDIKNASTNVVKLLDELLSWSLLQTNKMDYFPENILVYDIIDKEIQFINELAKSKHININHKKNGNLTVFCDMQMASIILRNILNNAIKFSYSDSEIVIETDEDDSFIKISIKDDGVGIDRAKQNMFSREKGFTTIGTLNEKGSGIGLMLCQELIKINSGKLDYETQSGFGTKFIISLPKGDTI